MALRSLLLPLLLVFLTVPFPAPAQGLPPAVIPGEVKNTSKVLEEVREKAQQVASGASPARWAEVVDAYHQLIQKLGGDLASRPAGDADHCLQVRWLCHLDLAALPPEALRLYRERVDVQARKWLELGKNDRDPVPLRRLVNETFCSSHTDQALDLLGDLAFERGAFDEAELWWRLLATPASEAVAPIRRPGLGLGRGLRFPDPKVDLARVRAKQFLARLFRGDLLGLPGELEAYRRLHPQAQGAFAGRSGLYTDTLQALLEDHQTLALAADGDAWLTFAGDASRNSILPAVPEDPNRLNRLCRLGPRWRFNLHDRTRRDEPAGLQAPPERIDRPSTAGRSLAFYPVVVGNHVLVADARYLTAYDLHTGQSAVWYDAQPALAGLSPELTLPAPPQLRYSLTVAGDRIFARFGTRSIGPGESGQRQQGPSVLVCLRLEPDEQGSRECWRVTPNGPGEEPAAFEGAPLVHEERVYIAATRWHRGEALTAIHCYPVHAAGSPAPLWRQDICATPEFKGQPQRFRHHLLTLAGPYVVYCSHSGAIVALDALTGQRAWAVRYPSHEPTDPDETRLPRDLVPCLYADGRVYAAPADSDRLLCLDGLTGQTLWERDRLNVVHLLGVARGKLIFTTDRAIRAVGAAAGRDAEGWYQPGDGSSLAPFGRGFLAGDLVFWPVWSNDIRRIFVLSQEDGEQPDTLDPAPLQWIPPGNLTFAGGCLVVTDTEEMSIYVPPSFLRQQAEEEVRQRPWSALAHYRLALVHADVGNDARAQEHFLRTERLASPDASWQGQRLRALARTDRHAALLEAARRARVEGNRSRAAAVLARAGKADFPLPARLQALAQRAALWTEANRPERAVETWQGIFSLEELRQGRIVDDQGNPQDAATYAAAQIDKLIQEHGRQVYASIERRAEAVARSGLVERLVREFPNATATGPALLRLAETHLEEGRPGAAADTYRAYLRHAGGDERLRAKVGLARAYEQQHCWPAASAAWQEVIHESGDRVVPGIFPEDPVRDYAVKRLEEIGTRPWTSENAAALPLLRTWEVSLPPGEHLLLPATCPPGERLFFVRGRRLTCRDAATGQSCWQCILPSRPCWLDRYADRILVGTANEVASLRQDDGHVRWRFSIPEGDNASASPALTAFQLSAGRLFCFQQERRLFALDAETGQVLWNRWAPAARLFSAPRGGRFHPHYHAGERHVLLQASGNRRWILDSQTGSLVHAAEDTGEAWPGPPVVLDGRHVCLAADRRTIIKLDLATGRAVWTHQVAGETTRTGKPPRLIADPQALLVIIPRNYGYALQRIDPQTGQAAWSREYLIGSNAPADEMAIDSTAVYLVCDRVLCAVGRANGRLLWKSPLAGPPGPWYVLRLPGCLAVFPREVPATHSPFRGALGPLEWAGLPWHVNDSRQAYPVVLCDAQTGKMVQRLNFLPPRKEASGSRLIVAVMLALRTVLKQIPERDQPSVILSGDGGMVVVRAGMMWRLVGEDRGR